MVGRGGGKNVGNRSIGPRRLYGMNQVARSNLNNIQDDLNRQCSSFTRDKEIESPTLNERNNLEHDTNGSRVVHEIELNDCESGGFLGKRKRISWLVSRIAQAMEVNEAAAPTPKEVHNNHINYEEEQGNAEVEKLITIFPSFVTCYEATSKTRGKGNRGKYKSYVVDMKIKGKGSKLTIEIPDEIDRAIGENARHLLNECGRIVRTRAPLNVKNWQEAFSVAGDSMWKETQDKFQIVESSCSLKMYEFVVDTMQRLYSPKCGKTDQERENNPPPDLPIEQWKYCIKRFGFDEFKRVIHTTGNLAFAEVEDILTKENNNVKPSTDVVWLIEHTRKNTEGELEWADATRSKTIHDKLKHVVAEVGDTMTQDEILIQVLEPRSRYIRGNGTALCGKLQEKEKRIKELQESQERQQREFEEHKAKQAADMEAFKQDLLLQLANRGV
ncbi:Glutamate receptor ionotropic NMDA 2D [Bienertia sinuspersici]